MLVGYYGFSRGGPATKFKTGVITMSGLKFTFKGRLYHTLLNLRYGRGQWVDARMAPSYLYREMETVHGTWTWVPQCVKCVNRPHTTVYLDGTTGTGLRVCHRCSDTMNRLQLAGVDVSKLPRLMRNGFPYQGVHGLKSENRFFNILR